MTNEEIDKAIAVLQAYKEGKKIEVCMKDSGAWIDTRIPEWNFFDCNYRIKSEPHYSPFKSAEEVMEAVKEHGDWVHKKGSNIYSNSIAIDNGYVDFMVGSYPSLNDAFTEYEFADGTPFGKYINEI